MPTTWFKATIAFSRHRHTDGDLLKGVHYYKNHASTQSLVMRSKSGTVRLVTADHQLDKLNSFSAIEFG